MPTINHYCCNPFVLEGHKIKKTPMFKQVDQNALLKYGSWFPNLKIKSWVCVGCIIAMDKHRKLKLQTPIPDPQEAEAEDAPGHSDDISMASDERESIASSSTSAVSIRSLDADIEVYDATYKLQKLTELLAIREFNPDKIKAKRLKDAEDTLTRTCKVVRDLLFMITGDSELQIDNNNSNDECTECARLVNALACRFLDSHSKIDKYKILTCLPMTETIADMESKFGCSNYMAKEASKLRAKHGAFSFPIFKGREGLTESVKDLVRSFYLSTDNSRVDPAVRGTILVKVPGESVRRSEAKRLIMMTLSELYGEFCQVHKDVEISISAFSLLRPKQCVWAGTKGFQNTCTCSIHQNFELILNACNIELPLRDIFEKLFCSTTSEACMLGFCNECPKDSEVENLFQNITDEEHIKYNYWGSIKGEYGTQLLSEVKSVEDFMIDVRSMLPNVASHHYIMKQQQQFFAKLKSEILVEEASGMLQLDFSQNYAFVFPNEVQSFYFSKKQATVHPCVFSWYSNSCNDLKSKSYVVISDELNHNATAVHAFITKVLDQIKRDHAKITKIYYVSDGAASQYKNSKNFVNLLHHEADFGLKAEWHFTATSHGKSLCDAMGAVTKRALRLASLRLPRPGETQRVISTANEMYIYCSENLASISLKFLLVNSDTIQSIAAMRNLNNRYKTIKTIVGTRSHHSFVPLSSNELKIRRFSLSLAVRVESLTKLVQLNQPGFSQGQYVGILVDTGFAVGMINEVDVNNHELIVQVMIRKGKGNSFGWPNESKEVNVVFESVVSIIDAPAATSSTGRAYRLSSADFERLRQFKVKK